MHRNIAERRSNVCELLMTLTASDVWKMVWKTEEGNCFPITPFLQDHSILHLCWASLIWVEPPKKAWLTAWRQKQYLILYLQTSCSRCLSSLSGALWDIRAWTPEWITGHYFLAFRTHGFGCCCCWIWVFLLCWTQPAVRLGPGSAEVLLQEEAEQCSWILSFPPRSFGWQAGFLVTWIKASLDSPHVLISATIPAVFWGSEL